jgi:hypothetical protein
MPIMPAKRKNQAALRQFDGVGTRLCDMGGFLELQRGALAGWVLLPDCPAAPKLRLDEPTAAPVSLKERPWEVKPKNGRGTIYRQ